MLKTFYKLSIYILIPLVIIGTVNYLLDVDYRLRKEEIPQWVASLRSGKMEVGPVNIHSRSFKKAWIDSLASSPTILVLGSSRTLNLRRETFNGQAFFNASITNCSLYDMLAYLYIFENKGQKPVHLIVNIDQWLLGSNRFTTPWEELRPEVTKMVERIQIPFPEKNESSWNLKKEYISDLFSAKYFLRCLRYRKKVEAFMVTDTIEPNKMMYFPDGSRRLPDYVTLADPLEIEQKAKRYFYENRKEFFTELDSIKVKQLNGFFAYLKKQGYKVDIFIPPYHPATYLEIEKSFFFPALMQADSCIRSLGEKYDFFVFGSACPEKLSLNGSDFYDGIHLKEEALNTLFTKYLIGKVL